MYNVSTLEGLGILQYGDSTLRQRSVEVGDFDAPFGDFIDNMNRIMYEAPGAGLSAVQVGVLKRVFVTDVRDEGGPRRPRTYANPAIVSKSTDMISIEEGCLSFANIYVPVQRHAMIEIRYQNEIGDYKEERLSDYEAIVFQHELDHLDGLTFLDRISRLRRDVALRRARKLARFEG